MFVLSLIVTVPLQAQLYAGKWVGSLQTPNTQPTGAHFIVGEDSDGWSLVPILGGLPPVAVTNLITTDSTLSFEWTPRSSVLTCNLHKIIEQGFEGTCRTPEASFHIRMLPPGTILNGLSRHAANHSDYTWVRDSTAHFQFYFSPQSYPWFHRDTLLANAEWSWRNGLRLLGEQGYPRPIRMFYLGSREATTALFGRPLWGWADPYSDTVVLAWNDERTLFNRHEIMHVLAWNLWGLAAPPFGWISEGLAVYAQGSCRDHDLHQLARVLRNRGELYGVDRLTQQFWQLDDVVAYVEAGSLVRFTYEVYGREATRRLWHGGVAEAEEALGVSLVDLEAMWHRHLDTVIPTREAKAWRAETC